MCRQACMSGSELCRVSQGSRRRATGAAVEPLRALHCTRSSAARLRAWRVTGVAIWPAPHRAQRPASRSVRQAGLVHAQREGIRARDPRAREGPPRVSAGSAGPTVLRGRWQPVRGEAPASPVARRAAQRPGPAPRGHALAYRDRASAQPHHVPPRLPHPAPTWIAVSQTSSIFHGDTCRQPQREELA